MKPKTLASYQDLWRRIIEPTFGDSPIAEVTRAEIIRWHQENSSKPTTANYGYRILRAVISFAFEQELIDRNPSLKIKQHKTRKMERFLSAGEIAFLFHTLDEQEELFTNGAKPRAGESKGRGGAGMTEEISRGVSPFFVGLIKLLTFTGCRLNEICQATWDQIDFDKAILRLDDSKTGSRPVILSQPAIAELRRLWNLRCQDKWIIENRHGNGPMANPQKPWRRIRELANLGDCRIHDLRHSAASLAIAEGASLPLTGKLLGHTQPGTTVKYAHLADDPVRQLAEQIGASIVTAVKTSPSKPASVVSIRKENV